MLQVETLLKKNSNNIKELQTWPYQEKRLNYIYMEKKPNNNLNTTQLQKTEKEVTNFLK